MNPDLELIQQYAQAIQATGLLEEDTVNGITAMVDRAREQFRVADEQGIPPETLQLLPDDQRAAMQEVLMQVQRSYSAKSEGEMMNERTYQVDDRMEQMTPNTYADRVARGEITPDELMMESSGSTMTEAEKAIRDNAEFNRRAQEEQERMFNMNNPPVMSGERPRLRPTQ